MNKNLFFSLLLLTGIWLPLAAHANDSASTTPEIVEPTPAVASSTPPATPETTPEEVSVVETASTTEPVATSTEPLVSVDPAPSIPPAVPITLTLATKDGTLFTGPLTVTACAATPDALLTVSGYCAIEQSGIPATWSWYGSDAFIDTIGGVGNDYTEGIYWNWFTDLSYGMTSLNAHNLNPGESLIVSIGRMPMRIVVAPEEAVIGSTTTVTVSGFAFDSHFAPIWEPAASSTVLINGVSYSASADGTVTYIPTELGTLAVTATKDGFLPAAGISIPVQEAPDSGTGGENNTKLPVDSVGAAVEFLRTHQRSDGSFASPLLSDWAAIAFLSANAPSRSLKQYLANTSDTLHSATDFERRAMALAALGINPQKEIGEIVRRFDGTQVGERSLLNDDIFALIALAQGGYTSSDPIVTEIVATLIKNQQDSGAWISTDLTAAGIQALAPHSSLPGVSVATIRAREYLASRVGTDGCFGNSFATSWGIMAIHALGESPSAWSSPNGATPLSCLTAAQATDGGFEEGASMDIRVWATAYAIPALAGKTWHDVLKRFPKSEGADEETRKTRETKTPPEEIVESEEATTLPQLSNFVPLEIVPVAVRVPERGLVTAEKITPKIPRVALTASAFAAIEQEAVTAHEESAWSFLMSLIRSLLALLF